MWFDLKIERISVYYQCVFCCCNSSSHLEADSNVRLRVWISILDSLFHRVAFSSRDSSWFSQVVYGQVYTKEMHLPLSIGDMSVPFQREMSLDCFSWPLLCVSTLSMKELVPILFDLFFFLSGPSVCLSALVCLLGIWLLTRVLICCDFKFTPSSFRLMAIFLLKVIVLLCNSSALKLTTCAGMTY